jgi:shikimate dehydrogenase
MKKFGLIGFPLGHSFSVPYFQKKFEENGIDAVYENFPMEDIAGFDSLIERESELEGLNVTVPYKEQVIPFLDVLSKTARQIQAVNTIRVCRRDGRLALIGHNTDVIGFKRSLMEHLKDHHSSALVLGTGGSSKAVLFVLEELGIKYIQVSRTKGEGLSTYGDLTSDLIKATPLIINTTPLGMHPQTDTYPDIPYSSITSNHLLFDLVYNPAETRFLALGREQGAAVVNGYDMLVYQAEGSWDRWNR